MAFSWLKGLFGGRKRGENPYTAAVQKKITQVQQQQNTDLKKIDARLSKLDREKKYAEMFADTRAKIKQDIKEGFEKANRDDLFREEPRISGPSSLEVPWILVSSSNVEAIRWVGGSWGLNVSFKNGYLYEYSVGYNAYVQMLNAPSKGQFVWMMRRSAVPYRRYQPSSIPPQIIYRFGHIGGPTDPADYQKAPYPDSISWGGGARG